MNADHRQEEKLGGAALRKAEFEPRGEGALMRVDPRKGSYALTSDPIFSPSTTRRIFP